MARGKEKQDFKDGRDTADSKPSKTKVKIEQSNGVDQQSSKPVDPNASWTGKFPMALLHEHCQKQKWHKVGYDVNCIRGEYVAAVNLSHENPKTRLVERVRLKPPSESLQPQPTPLLAKSYAATYSLYRILSHKSIHLTLPPSFRSYWFELEKVRKSQTKDQVAYLYAADPFQAAAQKQAQQADARAKVSAASSAKSTEDNSKKSKPLSRAWADAPSAEMSAKLREEVEKLVRTFEWAEPKKPLEFAQRSQIITNLCREGFRRSHCEESLEWSVNEEEALEWLLIHVPEDDLPAQFLPPDYSAGEISFLSMGGDGLKKEYALKRIVAVGYSREVATEALEQHGGDERATLQNLFRKLVYGDTGRTLCPETDVSDEAWNDEQTSLSAIYGSRLHDIDQNSYSIDLNTEAMPSLSSFTMMCSKPMGLAYPHQIPILSIASQPKLPAHVRLSILRQAGQAADSMVGDVMLFALVDWLEGNVKVIMDNPGRLREVSAATTGVEEAAVSPHTKAKAGRMRRHPKIDWTPGSAKSKDMLSGMRQREKSAAMQDMLATRRSLPAYEHKDAIVAACQSSQVVVISGETGSGKSTQSVQFILDNMISRELGMQCKIVCTQPRRISALGLADRVAEERGSRPGEEIGYAIRGETKISGATKIQFVTTGVLLRRVQMGDDLGDLTHIFVDEVHERSLDSDFLLILLKRILSKRKDLRVILMSATVDAEVFLSYFGGGQHIHIRGRTFPVQDVYLDEILLDCGYRNARDESEDISATIRSIGSRIDYGLIAATLDHLDRNIEDGAVLIFLPGAMEINRCLQKLHGSRYHLLPLHASLTPTEQRRVFPPAPKGKRKVICATNIAETSITINDVVAVIDSGRVKETSYNADTRVVSLIEKWASKAACQQRRGRAGRVRKGYCYKLYTQALEAKMEDKPVPDILRTPLEQVCLGVKAMGVSNVAAFLQDAVTPPLIEAIEHAMSVLTDMAALKDGELTPLGQHISTIPTDLRCAKLLVYGSIFGCLNECLTVASILSARSPFLSGGENREEAGAARKKFSLRFGDLLTDVEAFTAWLREREMNPNWRKWCAENYLSVQTLFDILSTRQQYHDALREIGFSANLGTRCTSQMVCSVVLAGLAPNMARISFPDKKYIALAAGTVEKDPEAKTIKYYDQDGRVFIHPSSTVFGETSLRDASFVSYFSKMDTSKVFIRQVSMANTFAVLFFGGKLQVDGEGRGMRVGAFRIRAWARIGVLVNRLRQMLDALLEEKIENPAKDVSERAVCLLVQRLIGCDGRQV